jgi:small conductance mechanosensitive channel
MNIELISAKLLNVMAQSVVALQEAAAPAATAPAAEPAPPKAPESVQEAIQQQFDVAQKGWDWMIDKGPAIIAALVLLVVGWIISIWVRRLTRAAAERAHIDKTLAKFFGNMAKWAILVFTVVTCLGTLGINTTSVAAIIGAAGLAIGLALQGNLGNLASGILLLIFRPFKVGDAVIVAGQAGVIDGIDLFTTNLDTADNRRIIIPNNAIFSGIIENQTHHPRRVITIMVPVNPGIPIDTAQSHLLAAAQRVVNGGEGALKDPGPAVGLAELTGPALIYGVTIHANTASVLAVRPRLLREIKETVDREGLAPPPPVQMVRQVV